jgi:gliding motility-associated lipoprotein GldD
MMLTGFRLKISIIPAILLLVTGCRETGVPKPRGHFRIDLPDKEYRIAEELRNHAALPFSFEYPVYGQLRFETENIGEAGWFNIEFPAYRGKIYLTYREINNDFEGLMEQTYKMNVKNHITKADAINEQVFTNDKDKVYGILYDLKGNTATAVQFYLTDSTRHYLRGSLYFDSEPDADSLEPVIDFFRDDVVHLMESLKWNN